MYKYVYIADLIAIPFFLLLVIYFVNKQKKTWVEYILLIFSIIGLSVDVFFSVYFSLF
jgi:hypothetical protein